MPTTRKRENVPARLVAAVREADQITAALRATGRPYAAFVFSRDLGRFIRPGMSEAHFRFLTQRSDPGPGWPERKPQRRRLPRRERPEAAYQKETGRRRPLSDEISGYEKALQLRARYSKAVVA